jgi:hypothetical protein
MDGSSEEILSAALRGTRLAGIRFSRQRHAMK